MKKMYYIAALSLLPLTTLPSDHNTQPTTLPMPQTIHTESPLEKLIHENSESTTDTSTLTAEQTPTDKQEDEVELSWGGLAHKYALIFADGLCDTGVRFLKIFIDKKANEIADGWFD